MNYAGQQLSKTVKRICGSKRGEVKKDIQPEKAGEFLFIKRIANACSNLTQGSLIGMREKKARVSDRQIIHYANLEKRLAFIAISAQNG